MTAHPATTIATELSETEMRILEDLVWRSAAHDRKVEDAYEEIAHEFIRTDGEGHHLVGRELTPRDVGHLEELLIAYTTTVEYFCARIAPAAIARAKDIAVYTDDPDRVSSETDEITKRKGHELFGRLFREAGIRERFIEDDVCVRSDDDEDAGER